MEDIWLWFEFLLLSTTMG